MASTRRSRRRDYPIRIHADDISLALSGEVVIAGPDAERFRDLILAHPDYYARSVVPYLRRHEATFQPTDVWIDAKDRVHVTNAKLVARARQRLAGAPRRGAPSRKQR